MSEETLNVQVPKKTKKSGSTLMRVMVLLLVAAIGVAVYFYSQYKDASTDSPEAVAARNAEESADVIDALGKVILLDNETDPTVAKVDDAKTLKEANPEFYTDVANGDYLVLYPNRAIIFRLDSKQIINVAPIVNTSNLGTSDATDTTNDTTAEDTTQ